MADVAVATEAGLRGGRGCGFDGGFGVDESGDSAGSWAEMESKTSSSMTPLSSSDSSSCRSASVSSQESKKSRAYASRMTT